MKIFILSFVIIFLSYGKYVYASTEWDRLNDKVGSLYQQGDYAGAIVIAKKTHQMAEREFGPDHSNVAASLNNLATLYFVQMQYSQARPLYKRALEIWINALGSKHPDVATGLENLAELQRKTRQDKEAESLEKRAATIRAMQR
ncbi:MAG: tetratricopeptide repeat-containing protein [Nitrosomonadaceae bacterium]